MSLTHKECVQDTLQYHPTDRLSTQINYTTAMDEKMASYLPDEAAKKIANDNGATSSSPILVSACLSVPGARVLQI